MTPPTEGPQFRRSYTDPRDILFVGHLLEATHLIERGHQLLHLELVGRTREQPGVRYAFDRTAFADLQAFRAAATEVAAIKERFLEARRRISIPTGDINHDQQR